MNHCMVSEVRLFSILRNESWIEVYDEERLVAAPHIFMLSVFLMIGIPAAYAIMRVQYCKKTYERLVANTPPQISNQLRKCYSTIRLHDLDKKE